MKNTFGSSVAITLFGESHGEAIGAVIDGLAPGIEIDLGFIKHQLSLRRPQGSISTSRREEDEFSIVSGVFEDKTTGAPICIIIPNSDTRSEDYGELRFKARPSHADYTAGCKYHGFSDFRGGGHFSGRITAAIVAAGAVVIPALKKKGIYIGSHIKGIGGIYDRDFSDIKADIASVSDKYFAVLDPAAEGKMTDAVNSAHAKGDSIGGMLETAVLGLEAGLGEPWFDTIEGVLSHALFSIPAIKGVEFGAGFGFCEMMGSKANDPFLSEEGRVFTTSNNSGGINGGISNGMPIIFRCAIRPTPTISKPQQTVDMRDMSNTSLIAVGRHDPCIVHRARIVVDSITALALCDILALRHGTDWLA